MTIEQQSVGERYAIFLGDCIEVMAQLPNESVHLSVYSPPFGGLYHYSSNERDLSNCDDYAQFFEHYAYVVRELHRLTLPGRMTAVHCMDVPSGNSGCDYMIDFPGDIIRLHERRAQAVVLPASRQESSLGRTGPRNSRQPGRTRASRSGRPRMKSCSTCGLWKSDRAFYPDRRVGRSRDGLHHACKDCEREAARDRARERYRRLTAAVQQARQ